LFLSSADFLEYLSGENPLVESAPQLETQIQPNGIELTLQKVEKFISGGELGVEKKERKLAETVPLKFAVDEWVFLEKGSYKIIFNEILHLPADLFALARPRSSLLRMGATIETALWDSGYHGRSESLLLVFNSTGIKLKKNARLVQLIFFKLKTPAEKTYQGQYQGENF
jgi:dUTP pyrophosphatase